MISNVIASIYGETNHAAHKLAYEWHEKVDIMQTYLDKVEKKMKKCMDTSRRHIEYKKGDQVMIKVLP